MNHLSFPFRRSFRPFHNQNEPWRPLRFARQPFTHPVFLNPLHRGQCVTVGLSFSSPEAFWRPNYLPPEQPRLDDKSLSIQNVGPRSFTARRLVPATVGHQLSHCESFYLFFSVFY